jgi:hypothetical protein
MRMMSMALLGFTLAASTSAIPASAQQSPSVLDQARRMLGGTEDQDAQRRAYEAGRRDEQRRQLEGDRDRRAGDYDTRRGTDSRRGYEDRRGYGSGSDLSGRAVPGHGGPNSERGPAGSPYDRQPADRDAGAGYRR